MSASKLIVFVVMFLSTLNSYAQRDSIANGSFEFWGGYSPNSWGTYAAVNSSFSKLVTIDSTLKYVGKMAMKITTDTIRFAGDTTPIKVAGLANYGSVFLSQNEIKVKGTKFTSRPDSFRIAIKYIPKGIDTAFWGFWLTKNGQYVGGISTTGLAEGATISAPLNWTKITLPFNYVSTATPDTLAIQFSSSLYNGKIGSAFWIDDISLVYKTNVGIVEEFLQSTAVNVFPNPTTYKLCFELKDATDFSLIIFDEIGNELYKKEKQNSTELVDVSIFPAGKYFYAIQKNNKKYTGIFIKE